MTTRFRRTTRHLTLLAAGMVAMLASIQSCVIDDTKTDLCASGRRCPVGWKCAAEQDVCIDDECGDGVVDRVAGELCDDGNIVDDETCSADCKTLPGCGNGRRENDEVCDDGDNVSGDGCSGDCASREMCGNSYRDVNEACDDGNTVGSDGCSADCKRIETCGNKQRDVGEVCDDGNTASGDGCSKDCLSNETCMNGYVDADEICDVGLADTPECNAKECTIPECGDSYLNSAFINPDNGVAEQCDDGGINTSECNANCTTPRCGDGFFNNQHLIDPGGGAEPYREQCDDGNDGVPADSSDCDRDCTRRRCGDGYTNQVAGEVCEDGNHQNGDACPDGAGGTCREAMCGDGFIRVQGDDSEIEECDDGAGGEPADSSDCDQDCTLSVCGDGYRNEAAGERCDDGNGNNNDACLDGMGGSCQLARCGDGFIRSGVEQCDYARRPNPGCAFPLTCSNQCTCI